MQPVELQDLGLRDKAVDALDAFAREHAPDGCPVERKQIHGLRQLAANEPHRIKEFVGHQRHRAEKRLAGVSQKKPEQQHRWQSEIDFWQLIENLCDGHAPKHAWSLEQVADQLLPPELRVEKLPPGTSLTKEQKEQRVAVKQRHDQWLTEWRRQYYAIFFQRFCAHYLYLGKPVE